MKITHLRRRYFPHRFGTGGNGGALYALCGGPITVAEFRRLLEIEREAAKGA